MANEVSIKDARKKAIEVHYPELADSKPGAHPQDEYVQDLLRAGLRSRGRSTRRGRSFTSQSRKLWDPNYDRDLSDRINQISEDEDFTDTVEAQMSNYGLVEFEDQYTGDRVAEQKTEVLTHEVYGLITPRTTMLNEFFTTIQGIAEQYYSQLTEYVRRAEAFSTFDYYLIDEDRGGIRSIEPSHSQTSDKINLQAKTYGVKAEYERFTKRVLPNLSIADMLSMLTVGWAGASARAREEDANNYLKRYLAPTTAYDNANPDQAEIGSLSGVAINGEYNGTMDVDRDVPRLMHHMSAEKGMALTDLKMLLPQNAWSMMNMTKGYRRFVGRDGQPLYQAPNLSERAPEGALADDNRYGLKMGGVGQSTARKAREALLSRSEERAERASNTLPVGPRAFLPQDVPNRLDVFTLPNSAMGPIKVVLTPYESAKQHYYPQGHPLRNDDITGDPRPVMTTDMLIVDATKKMLFVETLPPTSWNATNDEWRTQCIVMVEGYGMAPPTARGQQAIKLRNVVLDQNWSHDLYLEASKIKVTNRPVGGGMTTDGSNA